MHRLADLEPACVTVVAAVPCTSVARTLVDLGAVCSPSTVEAAVDRAIGRHVVTVADLNDIVREVGRKGRRGVGTMRKVLADRRGDDRPAGVLEARMMSLLRQAGLPEPRPEYEIRGRAESSSHESISPTPASSSRLRSTASSRTPRSRSSAMIASARTMSWRWGGPCCATRGPTSIGARHMSRTALRTNFACWTIDSAR